MAFFPREASQEWLFHPVEPFVSLSGGRYVRDLAYATGVALLSWLVTLLSVLIVALLVTLLGRSMFWYDHFYTSICLYGAAATGKIILIHTLAKNLYYGVSEVGWKGSGEGSGRPPPRPHGQRSVRFHPSLISHLPAQLGVAFVSFESARELFYVTRKREHSHPRALRSWELGAGGRVGRVGER